MTSQLLNIGNSECLGGDACTGAPAQSTSTYLGGDVFVKYAVSFDVSSYLSWIYMYIQYSAALQLWCQDGDGGW